MHSVWDGREGRPLLGGGSIGAALFVCRGSAWKDQELLGEEGSDRSSQDNRSQQFLHPLLRSLPLHCDSKAGISAVRKAPACGWR